MDKSLTIIIPAYNVSEYIEECMDSLIKNPHILDSLEIIAINDGSKDDTLKKLKQYELQYPSTVKVVDKENGGHGSGINVGIKLATGLYLKVLDSDDWVNNEGLTELVDLISSMEQYPDIILNPYEYVWQTDGHRDLCNYPKLKTRETLSLQQLNDFEYSYALHSLTIRTSICQNADIPTIDEKISYDDVEYILYPVPYINSVLYVDSIIYQYRYGMDGQSASIINYVKRREQHKTVILSLIRYYINNKSIFSAEQEQYYLHRLYEMINHHVNILCVMDDNRKAKEELREFIDSCKDVDLSKVPNRKLQFLLKTNCNGYSLLNWYYKKVKK